MVKTASKPRASSTNSRRNAPQSRAERDQFARFCSELKTEDGHPFVLYPEQLLMVDPYFEGVTSTFVVIPKKNGKALALETPVLTTDGWKTMGMLVAGDHVFAPDGSSTEVLWGSAPVQRQAFRVTFADGATLDADGGHEWAVFDRRYQRERVVTTLDMADELVYMNGRARRWRVATPRAVELPSRALPVDPYVLGLWLGDGTTASGGFTTADEELVEAVRVRGYVVTDRPAPYSYFVRGLQVELRRLGVLGNKHVPEDYRLGSRAQRVALLQGLLDTDGTVTKGRNTPRVSYCSTLEGLAQDVLWLARSLGFKATLRKRAAKLDGIEVGTAYMVDWTAYADDHLFRLERKQGLLRTRPNRPTRAAGKSVVSIEPLGKRWVKCIAVAHPSSCYLAGESLTPTHNSTLVAALAIYHLLVTPNAECIVVAASRDQAEIILRQVRAFIGQHPGLRVRMRVMRREVQSLDDTGRVRVIASDEDTADGVIPTLAIVDELHRHKDLNLYGVLRRGLGPRKGRIITISTAGATMASALGTIRTEAHEMPGFKRNKAKRRNVVRSPNGKFAFLEWCLDESDDPGDMKLVKLVNPAPWRTIEVLDEEHEDPGNTPWEWLRFACGVWTEGEEPWLEPGEWDKLAMPSLELVDGDPTYLAVDLAIRHESAALAMVQNQGDEVWAKVDILRTDSYEEVEARIRELGTRYALQAVVFDPRSFSRSGDILQSEGFATEEFPQSVERMAMASASLHKIINEGTLRHDGDAELRAQVLAGRVKEDERGWRLVKDPSLPRPIDALIALATAAHIATTQPAAGPFFGWG